MSPIFEKSFFKSPHLTDVVKYLAFEKIIKDFSPESIIVVNTDFKLNNTLEDVKTTPSNTNNTLPINDSLNK